MTILSRETRYELKRHMYRLRGPLIQLSLSSAVAVMAALLFVSTPGVLLENTLLGLFFRIRGPITPPSDVVIIAVDDESFRQLDQSPKYPIPRRYIADALEVIQSASPRLVILDANIPQERHVDPIADARLEAALRSGPFVIWNGQAFDGAAAPREDLSIPSEERFQIAAKMELPMSLYLGGSKVVYISNPTVKPDAPLSERLWLARPLTELAGVQIAVPQGMDLINYYGPPGTISRLPIWRVTKRDDREVLKRLADKIILLGYQSVHHARGTSAKDSFNVPVSDLSMYGVEVHATIVGNLVERNWLRRLSLVDEMLAVLLMTFILSSIVMRAPRPVILAGAWCSIGVLITIAYLAFSYHNFWIAGIPILVATMFLVTVGSAILLFIRSEAYRRYLDRTFTFERERKL